MRSGIIDELTAWKKHVFKRVAGAFVTGTKLPGAEPSDQYEKMLQFFGYEKHVYYYNHRGDNITVTYWDFPTAIKRERVQLV